MRLIRIALLTATLAFVLIGSARAQYELTWDKCPGSYGAVTNKMFACDDAAQPMVLVAAFTPQRSLPRFVGLTYELEVTGGNGDLPDWWKMGIGECREGAVSTGINPGLTLGECSNPWLGSITGGGSQWEGNYYGAGRARFQFAYAREKRTALAAGTRYFGGTITIDPAASSNCAGCNTEVCIAIRAISIAQEKDPNSRSQDQDPDDEFIITNSTGTNVASFNLRNAANACGAKSRNKTWGQVKATYRR